MSKNTYVQLAHVYKGQNVRGWLWSEKLDGMRCLWDGGRSRGVPAAEVPYANTEKDHRLREAPVATGLWSRAGKVIHAPDWWLDMLPELPADGELYAGRGMFQYVMSTVRRFSAGPEWGDIEFVAFAEPNMELFLGEHATWYGEIQDRPKLPRNWDLSAWANDVFIWHPQHLITENTDLETELDIITAAGGEGIMLLDRDKVWQPSRVHNLLKMKRYELDEGTVIGYTWGRETDKGSKLTNLMGQVGVRFNGKEFGLSGFTEEERVLYHDHDNKPTQIGQWEPGCECYPHIYSELFPRGSTIRFKYRELTRDGLPKEARYMR